MKKNFFLIVTLLALTQTAKAQNFFINSGGPTSGVYQTDNGFIGGATQANTTWGTGVFKDVRYGQSFSYSFEVPNGFYLVNILTLEPNNQATGLRTFTVTTGGFTTPPIDLFTLCGYRQQCTIPIYTEVTNRVLKIDFNATVGNAVVTGLEVKEASLKYISCVVTAEGVCEIKNLPTTFNALPAPNVSGSFLLLMMGSDPNVHPVTQLKVNGQLFPLLSFITGQPLPVQLYKIYQVWFLDGQFKALNIP